MSASAISFQSVSKIFKTGTFAKKTAVDNLSFEIPAGEVIGLIGANGSGKSTSIKMMLGFLRPSAGDIFISGLHHTDQRARQKIGYLPENPRFQKFLTGRDVLKYYATLLGLDKTQATTKIPELLELVGLKHATNEKVHGYSKGMTQRLAIAQSLLSKPDILIYDEPMSGLDPLGRREIRNLIANIHDQMPETTLFFSSHILNDIENLCSSVLLLKKGKLTRHCNVQELLGTEGEKYEVTVDGDPKLSSNNPIKKTAVGYLFAVEGTESLTQVLNQLKDSDVKIVNITSHRKNLEETLFSDRTVGESL